MDINKAHWSVDEGSVHVQVPISKIDKESRIVSGFATLDNVDTANEVLTFESSKKAFERSRARIREMHQPKAVGKIVNFKEQEFYDAKTQKSYRGIYVDAYISKGAEDTWLKVQEGVLSAFSVGGDLRQAHTKVIKDSDGDRLVRYITDWELNELSLVDNPGNQLANIMSIQKSEDGTSIMKGIITDVKTENIFWCAEDEVAQASPAETQECIECNGEMKTIGWFEEGDNSVTKIEEAISKVITTATIINNEGGANVADNAEATVVEEATAVAEETEEAVAEEANEEAVAEDSTEANAEETVEKAADEASDVQKSLDEFKAVLEKSLVANATEWTNKLDELANTVQEVTKSFEDKVAELTSQNEELAKKLDGVADEVNSVEKRVDGVESSTATKKSGDLGGSLEKSRKAEERNIWAGRFVS